MGCNLSRVAVITENLPSPTIDDLPVEIIYKIFDELDVCTILVSLCTVNKRFNQIISTYKQYHLNLKAISLTNFDLICSRIRPEQVTELTLSDDESTSGLVGLFLSRFSINAFVRLHSLTLIQIDNEELMTQILIPLADWASLDNFSSLKIINKDEAYGEIFTELIMSILSKSSLRKINFDLSYNRTTSNPLPWADQSSIRHMTFPGNCTVSFVRNTFSHVPRLKTFEVDDFDFDDEVDLANAASNNQEDDDDNNSDANLEMEFEIEANNEEDEEQQVIDANNNENPLPRKEQFASITPTDHLTSLTLNACTVRMSQLEWLLKEMIVLERLRLITSTGYDDESILDGLRWEPLVSNLNKFEFVFSVNIADSSVWNINHCLETFRTLFWIEDKQWFVSLEKYDDEIILYTLPYLNDFYVLKNKSSTFEYRSTASENSLLQIQSMKNVHDLYIDASIMKEPQIENAVFPRFSHVNHLFLYGKWPRSNSLLTDIIKLVDLNTVEELIREDCTPTIGLIALLDRMPNIQSIKTTTTLLDALNAAKFCHKKCLRSFTVDPNNYGDQRCVNIEPFCAMFPRIQHLTIPVDNVDSCQYVLDQLNQDLISVIFRIPTNDSVFEDNENENEEENSAVDLFSEWIEELPEQYRSNRKPQQIHIWLK